MARRNMKRSPRPPLIDSFNLLDETKNKASTTSSKTMPITPTDLKDEVKKKKTGQESQPLDKHGYVVRRTLRTNVLTLTRSKCKALQPVIPLTRIEAIPGTSTVAAATATRIALKPQDQEEIALVRNLISTILIHPNLLGHEDCRGLRKFLENLGVILHCKTTAICIPLEPSDSKPLIKLHPPLPKTESPFLCSFGFIEDMTIDAEKKYVYVNKYSLMPAMKAVIKDILERLYATPQIVYESSYTFLYEFLIHLGARPKIIDEFVKLTSSSSNYNESKNVTANGKSSRKSV